MERHKPELPQPESLKNTIELAIARAHCIVGAKYSLVMEFDVLKCVEKQKINQFSTIIYNMKDIHITSGFSETEWEIIVKKIIKHIERKEPLCQQLRLYQ